MNLKEYMDVVVNTSVDDWNVIACWGAGSGPSFYDKFTVWNTGKGEFLNIEVDSHANTAILKSDLSVTIAWGITHNDDFTEEWANKFSDPKAISSFLDFFYNGSLVYRDIIVAVDGGRCYIPLPDRDIDDKTYRVKSLTLPSSKYELVKLINEFQSTIDYDMYCKQAGINVIQERWPK